MPKDEFDFDDPMELNGMALLSHEDTTDAMTECFIEEFMRLGYDHKQVLALFRNPHYAGMNMVLQNRSDEYVRHFIAEVFARWGKNVVWSASTPIPLAPAPSPEERETVIQPAEQARPVEKNPACDALFPRPEEEGQGEGEESATSSADRNREQRIDPDATACDPMGAAIPRHL